jgi:Fe-S oxidoreductase
MIPYETSRLNWDACRECGDCLTECRYLSFTRPEAVREMRNLKAGRPSFVADHCASCYACDATCSAGAHPYERFLARWYERYQVEGLPPGVDYLLGNRRPNFRQDISYQRPDRQLHAQWDAPTPPARTVLYPGCNLLSVPRLLPEPITQRLPVWGRWDLCCGEIPFRLGLMDQVRRAADRLTRFYAHAAVDEVVFYCPACYNMFKNVLPEQFGARFPFRATYFAEWFLGELDRGMFRLRHRLHGTVALHDSCHGRVLGPRFLAHQRELLARLGLDVVTESPSAGRCCGISAGVTRHRGLDVFRSTMGTLDALDQAHVDQIGVYCTGCALTLSGARFFKPVGNRIEHFLPLIAQALGAPRPPSLFPTSFRIFKGIVRHAVPARLGLQP